MPRRGKSGRNGRRPSWMPSSREKKPKKTPDCCRKEDFFFLMKDKSFQEVEMRTCGLGGLQGNALARGIVAKSLRTIQPCNVLIL